MMTLKFSLVSMRPFPALSHPIKNANIMHTLRFNCITPPRSWKFCSRIVLLALCLSGLQLHAINSATITGEHQAPPGPEWIHNAVFYQIYPQIYKDTNGDGIGDLEGIIQKLDYIKSLGVDGVWINPFFESPFNDAGYDISDYCKVDPRYGTNADAKRLFEEAEKRGLKIIFDYRCKLHLY